MTVYNSQQVEALVLIRDGLTMAADGVNKLIKSTEPKEPAKPTPDEISSLRYEDKSSDKGPYKTASKSDNPDNPAFLRLQNYLQENNGFVILHGFKFWTFSNNPDILGRRKNRRILIDSKSYAKVQ